MQAVAVALAALALGASAGTAAAQVVLDQIAVTIDNQVIAESDLTRYLRVAAFLDSKPVDLSPAARRAAASALVDQALMMAEAADSHFSLPTTQDIPPLLEQVKAGYSSTAAYEDALKRYRITEQDLGNHLLAGARALRFTDLRFLPEVQISDAELRTAYDKYVAEWRATHTGTPPSFEESRADLEKLLTGQDTMRALDRWLETARKQKHVEYREAAFR